MRGKFLYLLYIFDYMGQNCGRAANFDAALASKYEQKWPMRL